jgi:nucleotide-binding universal stress UspA family protein
MFKNILVAVTNDGIYPLVLAQAVSIAKANNAQLKFLQVLSHIDHIHIYHLEKTPHSLYPVCAPGDVQCYLKHFNTLEQQGIEFLSSLTNQAIAQGITAEFTQVYGDPGRQICTIAQDWPADLIIVGRRGLRGIHEFLLGSVSNYKKIE